MSRGFQHGTNICIWMDRGECQCSRNIRTKHFDGTIWALALPKKIKYWWCCMKKVHINECCHAVNVQRSLGDLDRKYNVAMDSLELSWATLEKKIVICQISYYLFVFAKYPWMYYHWITLILKKTSSYKKPFFIYFQSHLWTFICDGHWG